MRGERGVEIVGIKEEMRCETFEGAPEGIGIDCPRDAKVRGFEVAGTFTAD